MQVQAVKAENSKEYAAFALDARAKCLAAASALKMETCLPTNPDSAEPCFTTRSGGICVDDACKFRHHE
eukprot:2130369-Amphidinium_carterae.1